MSITIDLGAVIATKGRSVSLLKTLTSLAAQSHQPRTIVIVDASPDLATKEICDKGVNGISSKIRWIRAAEAGAAVQRNLGAELIEEDFIWFFDDDIQFQEQCVARIWEAIQSDSRVGGVNAMIVNQSYGSPGKVSRWMFRLLNGDKLDSYAGRIVGPALNLLPDDRADLPEVVPVDWLNTTCTIYRREAMPCPPFDASFVGYSLMEDVTLSLRVAQRGWKLVNARTARIYHESQGGDHKADAAAVSEMELTNRHLVMTKILNRRTVRDYLKLALWEMFSIASVMRDRRARRQALPIVRGKLGALRGILKKEKT